MTDGWTDISNAANTRPHSYADALQKLLLTQCCSQKLYSISKCALPALKHAAETTMPLTNGCHNDSMIVLGPLPSSSLGTKEICCPKCHFSSVQNHQFRPKFRPNFEFSSKCSLAIERYLICKRTNIY